MKKRIQVTITLENIPENSAAMGIVEQPIKNTEKMKWLADLIEAGRAHAVCIENAPTDPVNPVGSTAKRNLCRELRSTVCTIDCHDSTKRHQRCNLGFPSIGECERAAVGNVRDNDSLNNS